MQDYEIEPGEYDEDTNEHGALRAIATQLQRLGHIAEAITVQGVVLAHAIDNQAEAQRHVADVLNRLADILGGIAQTWRATLPDDSPKGRLRAAITDAQKLLNKQS